MIHRSLDALYATEIWTVQRDVPTAQPSLSSSLPSRRKQCVQQKHNANQYVIFYCYNILFIDFRERKERRRRNTDLLSTYLCTHWLILVCALTGDQNHNVGVSGQRSNPLCYPTRSRMQFWSFQSHYFLLFLFLFVNPHLRHFFTAFREGKRERHWHEREALIGCHSYAPGPGITCAQTRDGTHNPDMCPDWKLNPQPFCYRTPLQPTEAHQPGPITLWKVEKG